MHSFASIRRSLLLSGLALAVSCSLMPLPALATSSSEKKAEADAVRAQLVSLQSDLEKASDDYNKAQSEQEAAQEAMEEAQGRIDETNGRIADLQERLGDRARDMYISGSLSPIDFLLGATSFTQLATNWDLLGRMNDQDAALVDESKSLRAELEEAHEEYAAQEAEAKAKADEAAEIQAATEARIAQANDLVASLDEEAKKLLEEEQAAEAARLAAQQQVSTGGGNSGITSSPRPVPSYGSVVDYARSRIGCPYVWGAAGPNAFDCSGLVQWAYAQVGKSVPHYTESLYAQATNIVPVSQARPGDVLYRPGHVGIACAYGGYPYVHAPTFGALVRDTDPLSWSGFTCALQFS